MLKQIIHQTLLSVTLLGIAVLYGSAVMEGAFSARWAQPHVYAKPEVVVETPPEIVPQVIKLDNVGHLQQVLEKHEYRFEDVMQRGEDIPRLFFINFPKDIRHVKCVTTKKALFLQTLLPIILHVNEEVTAEREKLFDLHQRFEAGETLEIEEQAWLQKLAQKYKLKRVDWGELKLRVDIIPPSMALGQAVIESGWGWSYAARVKNSPYGMTISDQVKFYQSLLESTYYYVRNLNSHRAYREMRRTRAQLRAQGKTPDGYTLIGDLLRYSEQKWVYINKVRRTIARNNLAFFDSGIRLQQVAVAPKAEVVA
ncbi:MAG: glucosaminidase domain-containing protein [Pseudomonadota bacterium]